MTSATCSSFWCGALLALSSCATPLGLPVRPASAPGGRELVAKLDGLGLEQREAALRAEIRDGNVPSVLRRFVPIALRGEDALGVEHELRLEVLPDVLGVGSDADWVRTPMTPGSAVELAEAMGCVLPTPRIVDAIWEHASEKTRPVTFHPREHDITAWLLFAEHSARIDAQLASPGALVAGAKKDLVQVPDLPAGRVAIYGWHRRDGRPIQPAYTGHVAHYVDYSHGVRLVRDVCQLDGRSARVSTLLADPVLHRLLSSGEVR